MPIPLTRAQADLISAAMPLVDRDGDTIKESIQVAYLEEVNGQMQTLVSSVLDTSDVPVRQAVDFSDYEAVAASQTDQIMGITGGVGDVLAQVMVYPATTSPGNVIIKDGTTTIATFTGGASSVDNLKPFPMLPDSLTGAKSASGAWKVTTGANVSALALGRFNQTALVPLPDTYISLANGGEQLINVSQATYAFSQMTLGTADFRRKVLLAFWTNGGSCTHSSVTANGGTITFTKIADIGAGNDSANANFISLWAASVPDGTVLTAPTLNITGTNPSRAFMCGWTHGRGTVAGTPIEAGSASANDLSGTIDVPTNGAVFAIGSCTNSPQTCTWTGITEQFDKGVGAGALVVSGGLYASVSGTETGRSIVSAWTAPPAPNIRMLAVAFGAQVTS